MVLIEGLKLMVMGMTVVALFLSLLVLAMSGSAAFFRWFPNLSPDERTDPAVGTEDSEVAVAIAAVKSVSGRK